MITQYRLYLTENADAFALIAVALVGMLLAGMLLHRIIVGPFTADWTRRIGEPQGEYSFRYERLLRDPAFVRRRRWLRIRGFVLWTILLVGAAPMLIIRLWPV